MDFSKIEGLTPEQVEAIEALAKAEQQAAIEAEVIGLKSKNNELIAEQRRAAEEKAEAEKREEKAKQEAEIERAKKANDLASLEATLTEKFSSEIASEKSKSNALIESVREKALGEALAEIGSSFIAPSAAKLMLKPLIDINLNEENKTVAGFKDFNGNVIATDAKSFIEWAGKNEELSQFMKPIETAGGGAGGGSGLGVGHKAPKDMSSQERIEFKKRDPSGFKKAFNL